MYHKSLPNVCMMRTGYGDSHQIMRQSKHFNRHTHTNVAHASLHTFDNNNNLIHWMWSDLVDSVRTTNTWTLICFHFTKLYSINEQTLGWMHEKCGEKKENSFHSVIIHRTMNRAKRGEWMKIKMDFNVLLPHIRCASKIMSHLARNTIR